MQTELLQALLRPRFYPHAPLKVEHVETHISHVFLADSLVLKIKKPVNLGFLDFSSPEKRKFFCQEEIRLNRRLAPDVYLGLRVISQKGSDFFLHQEGIHKGKIVEYAVLMKRLPAERMLSRLLKSKTLNTEMIRQLANILVRFHARADPCLDPRQCSGPEVLKRNIKENHIQCLSLGKSMISGKEMSLLYESQLNFIKNNLQLFFQRISTGKIREGHGDLRLEHICMLDNDQIQIFDCIEFNKRFRFIDVAAEIAFLAMDLERMNARDLAEELVKSYILKSQDPGIYQLLPFYLTYYAQVRAKVQLMRWHELRQNALTDTKQARQQLMLLKQLIGLGVKYAHQLDHPVSDFGHSHLPPCLISMCGPMGSGKSYLARELSRILQIQVLSSDWIRKKMAGIAPCEHRFDGYGQGIYCKEMTDKTYDLLLSLAEGLLQEKKGVILDASFGKRKFRDRVQELARKHNAGFLLIECTCPQGELRQRLLKRSKRSNEISDGRLEILENQLQCFEFPDEIDTQHHIPVLTTADLKKNILLIRQKLKELGPS